MYNQFIFRPLYNGLVGIMNIIPGIDLGVAVIIFTCVIRFILFPLSKSALITQVKMKNVEPEANRIKAQYANNKQEQALKIMELYKEKKIKPSDVLKEGFIAKEPTDAEITNIYNTYKSQFGGKSLPEVKNQIAGLMKNQQEQEHNQKVYKEIISKYPVEFKIKEAEAVRVSVEKKNNPSIGKPSAKVTIIEFSDFECPYCKRSQDVNRRLREKYKDDVEWVFRDYPLPFHENAMYAHIAANCTIPQGKYWQAFDILFANSGDLSPANVDFLVTKAGVDKAKFQECMKNKDKIQAEIQTDIDDGQKVGVNGTPAFFINGIFVSGALPFENFDEIIQKELNK